MPDRSVAASHRRRAPSIWAIRLVAFAGLSAVSLVAVIVMPSALAIVAPAVARHLPPESCASAEGALRVGIVIDFGILATEQGAPSTPSRSCAAVDERANGFTILHVGGHFFTLNGSGLLCSIDGYPDAGECGERVNSHYRYWAYFLGDASGWNYSKFVGPGSFHPTGPGVQGWHFVEGAGGPSDPPPNGPSDPNVTCPPPTTAPPATAPAPSTAPVATTEPTAAPAATVPSRPTDTVAGASASTTVPGAGPADPTRPAPGPGVPTTPRPGGPAASVVAPAPSASAGPASPGALDVTTTTTAAGAPPPEGAAVPAGTSAPAGTIAGAGSDTSEEAAVPVIVTSAGSRSSGSPLAPIIVIVVVVALGGAAGFRFRTRSGQDA